MNKSDLFAAIALAGVTAVLSSGPALAHHAVNAQFDPGRDLTMAGVLAKFDNRNPHAYWTFKDPMTGSDWRFESSSPATLRRSGIKLKEDINVGTTYTLLYSPSRDGSHNGLLKGMSINGKMMKFGGE
jgi:Family of unknown function (DUF6152)